MRKLIISMIVILLVFSELNVSIAEMSIGDATEPEAECEEQLESDSEENLATEDVELQESDSEEKLATRCEEQSELDSEGNSVTEGEEQLEPDNEGNSVTEGEGQLEPEIEENLTTEGEEQPESEIEEDLTTEREEQAESENEENLANACETQQGAESEEEPVTEGEEQLESDSEENLATEAEEQSKSDVEEKVIDCEEEEEPESEENLEIDCVEKFDSEGELEIEGKGQPESNSKEELVTEGEEQEELDSEEKSAPKCKRDIRKAGMPISSVGKIGNIDFSQLDDSPNDLNGFTQITKNEGMELHTKDSKGRKYYMYFGDLYNGRSVESLNNSSSYLQHNDDWFRPLPSMNETLQDVVYKGKYTNASFMQIATALAINPYLENGVVTYYYYEGRASKDGRGNGLTIASGDSPSSSAQNTTTQMPILKLYKNEETHELIAYAAVVYIGATYDYLLGYIKIKMSPVSNIGRINVNMKYLKKENMYPYTNLAYAAHLDIGKRHTNSRMYSLGDNKGMYLHEKGMGDGQDYVLYFLRDGYANSPVAFRGNDNPNETPAFSLDTFPQLNTMGIKDPGKDVMYPYQTHPGWAFRWEPMLQEPNKVREENLQIAVTDKPVPPDPPVTSFPPVIQLDNEGEFTKSGYHIKGTWKDADSDYVTLFYKIGDNNGQIGVYKNPNLNTDVPWEFTIPIAQIEKGLDQVIMVYAYDGTNISNFETKKISPKLTITEQVFSKDGTVPTEIAPNETLKFEILVDSGYITKDKGTYGELTIIHKYDTHLEPPTDLKIIDVNGREIGTTIYNASSNTILAIANTNLPRSTKVKVTFNAKVKENAAKGEFVTGWAVATGKYSTGDEINQVSNNVKIIITGVIGVLEFVSAPQAISFGDKLTISSRNKTYHPINLDAPLAVKDNRSLSKKPSWAMTARLDQPLTGKKTRSTLDSLHYRYGGNVSILTEDASVQIYKKETTNGEVVNISDTWNPDGDGLYLEVTAGTAKADAYEGTIRWVLQDVPLNK
ncbi:hypothetical protein ABNX05_21280 [Lysinibacillus sp. M3]|uniref:WxL domain-containing protein n=1 Tax=Lysinibacillus zambalensis TaxID=3160866 RepID=A0ABV1MXC7_9BACI